MDINGFREAQSPWFFSQPATQLVDIRNNVMVKPDPRTLPTQDVRYPGWAAPMNDGRIATDYRSHCEVNIPTGMQYASRQFMQKNADALISQARKRQAAATGAGLAWDSSTLMPPVAYVSCDTGECHMSEANPRGMGVERMDAAPELFGTFAQSYPSMGTPAKPSLTQREEGGRNTRR
jgi:hypothetical protein